MEGMCRQIIPTLKNTGRGEAGFDTGGLQCFSESPPPHTRTVFFLYILPPSHRVAWRDLMVMGKPAQAADVRSASPGVVGSGGRAPRRARVRRKLVPAGAWIDTDMVVYHPHITPAL